MIMSTNHHHHMQRWSFLKIHKYICFLPCFWFQGWEIIWLQPLSCEDLHIFTWIAAGVSYTTRCHKNNSPSGISREQIQMIIKDQFGPVGPLIWTSFYHLSQRRATLVQLVQSGPRMSFRFVFERLQKGDFFGTHSSFSQQCRGK